MGFRKFFSQLNNSQQGEAGNTDPITLPPRPRSQLAVRSSEPTPQTLQRRKSDSKRSRSSFSFSLSLQFYSGATGGATLAVPSFPGHYLPVPKIDETKSVKFSSPAVDPTAAHKHKPDWKSTLHASAGLVIDVVKESSDPFTPLKAVAGGLSAILKHYDVRHTYFSKHFHLSLPN